MEEIELNIGGQPVKLSKSQQMIGLKPHKGHTISGDSLAKKFNVNCSTNQLSGFQIVNVMDQVQEMDRTFDLLCEDPDVCLGSHVYHTSDDGIPFIPTGDIYIEFKEKYNRVDFNEILEKYFLKIINESYDSVTVKVTSKSTNPIKIAVELQKNPLIAIAEPDLASPAKLLSFELPSDPLLSNQWHLNNTGMLNGSNLGLKKGADARVVEAWSRLKTLGSENVIVAVIDDGFDLKHPDLSGAGKIVAPYDFTRKNNDPRPEINGVYPWYNWRNGSWIGDWHGTPCAGVAVGNANDTGIIGAAPLSKLMPVRWGPDLSNSQVVSWFDYVRTQGADIVSCSWGSAARIFPLSTPVKKAISRCAKEGRNGKGCIICFAAGNDNSNIDDPSGTYINGFANHKDVITVAATNSRDQKSHYSNYGKSISVCAPSSGAGGNGILTSDVTDTFNRNGNLIAAGYSPGDFTLDFGGTSSSTPLVAGICALLVSINPDLTAKQIKSIIEQTARKIGDKHDYDTNGHSIFFGFGCINAHDAALMAEALK